MRRSNGKRILALILALITLFSTLTLTSCNRKYNEDEVLEAAKKLLKTAEMLNIVYYGSGIEFFDSEEGIGYYRKANPQHLETLGFSTISELKEITSRTFSEKYCATINSTVLSALRDDTTVVSNARYYQAQDEKTGEPTHIMVHSKYTPLFKSSIVYDYDSMRVEGSKKEKVNLTVKATVTSAEGLSQITTVTVTLVEEENGWRIDNPTYANYNAAMDRYDELKDQEIK